MFANQSFESILQTYVLLTVVGIFAILLYHFFEWLGTHLTRLRRWRTRRWYARHRATQPPHAGRKDFELREPADDLDVYDESRFPG